MKAAVIHGYGSPEVLSLEEIPKPLLGKKDVLVQVHASSINPIDWKIRQGTQRLFIPLKFPFVLGMDLSGVVSAVGEEVTQWKVGDEVYGSPSHKKQGCYAEYCAVDERELARKPSNLTHEEAASLPLVALTAYEGLIEKGKLQKGQKVLIHAGSGGVGSIAIQMAKIQGAWVATTCSAKNADWVRSLGADQVIDYTSENFEEMLSDFDLVLDTLGGESREKNLQILRKGGFYASVTGDIPHNVKKYGLLFGMARVIGSTLLFLVKAKLQKKIGFSTIIRPANGKMLQKITEWVEKEELKPIVDKAFSLDEIQNAHEYSETSRAKGKIVLSISS